LLVRYGFCIEENVHEHVWVKVAMAKFISPYPDLFNSIQAKGLPISYKVKLKPYIFCSELVVFYRMNEWKLTHHKMEDIFSITDLNK
jgi:hypothetical protein